MKRFFEDPDCFGFSLFLCFILIVLLGGTIFGQSSDKQKFDAYQKALLTITQCRSATAGDVDKLCGTVPTTKDFGITQ